MLTKHTLAHDPAVTETLAALPALYATDGMKGDRPAVKLFDAAGSAFWVIWEYDAAADEGFGYGEMFPGGGELGYVPVSELRSLGLRVEQDAFVSTMYEGYESRGQTVPGHLAACPMCVGGYEPTSMTGHMFCSAHAETEEVS